MSGARNRNELWARVLLDELARAGVRHLVVAPGSRSAPLVLAAASDARFRIAVQIDERSAGFLALGVGKATAAPAAAVTTSGTAVANLLPAVVEAARSEVPLLLLTADRPPRLRGADANQVIDQVGILGDYPRLFVDLSPADASEPALRHLRSVVCRAVAAAIGDPAGPVHLNLSFDVPLEPVPVPGDLPDEIAKGRTPASGGRPNGEPWTRVGEARLSPGPRAVEAVARALSAARRPILVGGITPRPWEAGPALRRFARAVGIPLLADALSGGRFPHASAPQGSGPRGPDPEASGPSEGEVVVGGYDLALRNPTVAAELRPDLILRVGAAPTSAVLLDWMGKVGARHVLVDGGAGWKDHQAIATDVVRSDPGLLLDALAAAAGESRVDAAWRDAWCRVARRVDREVSSSVGGPTFRGSHFEGGVAADLGRGIPSEDILFVSGSLAVREIDTFLTARNGPLLVLGNRGASGIDGIVSTAAGASLGSGRRVVALVGDLAFLHDANGLAALREPGVRVTVVVMNNDGGGIFHFLPVREHEPAFTAYFVTPQGRDLAHLSALHGLPHERVEARAGGGARAGETGREGDRGARAEPEGVGGLHAALGRIGESGASGIVEVRTDREENRRRRDEVTAAIASSAGDALSQRPD